VPLILVAGDDHPALQGAKLRDGGKLGDVSPTILELLGLPQPPEMTGHSLISRQ
jgi:2,3-bisphosphoglycerate-independent phosphoglycerate mutase